MRVAALISGGKDSCYNMMQCVAEGHEIIALANLKPCDKDELDSYMYQTVGHHAIDLYADAMQLPLYRRVIQGTSLELNADYQETKDDEVEDLYVLLSQIKDELNIDAIAVGAILSDYQRVRVENVCSRLDLSVLAYLWRRDQAELLAEMIACHVEAIVIKVATLGLNPKDHLGKTIKELQPHLLKMNELYGINICGEGGEYETFTLDCPLFLKRIVMDEHEMVMHSNDAYAPVAYLNLKSMHLEDKPFKHCLRELPLKLSKHLLLELFPEGHEEDSDQRIVAPTKNLNDSLTLCPQKELLHHTCWRSHDGYFCISGLEGYHTEGISIQDEVKTVLDQLKDMLTAMNLSLSDLVAVHLFIANMEDFATINTVYREYFTVNPPVRVCVAVPLRQKVLLSLDCIAFDAKSRKLSCKALHVQGISHWAPANIGPYSQAIMVGQQVFVAGQIALCPATMTMVKGEHAEARLSLRHVDRILKAMNASLGLRDVTLAICYVTDAFVIPSALGELRRTIDLENEASSESLLPLVACICVPALPRHAGIEWHVVAALSKYTQKEFIEANTIEHGITYKVLAHKQRMSEDSSALAFIISLESVDKTISSAAKLHDVTSTALHQLASLLNKQNWNYKYLHTLRVFYSAEEYLHTDLQNAYTESLCNIFDISLDENMTVFVPVCGFQSPNCLMIICHT